MNELLDVFLLIITAITIITAAVSIKKNIDIRLKQEKEISLYHMYVKPLEELIKDIRAKQHEFDNHMNAILNMHIMIDDYDTLVEKQSVYINNIVEQRDQSFIGLLRISDKVLAGFIYSKLSEVKEFIDVEVLVSNHEFITNIPESELVEIIGTFIDNAIEACDVKRNKVRILIGSYEDKLLFEVQNQFEELPVEMLARFFEAGYSTKCNDKKRGLGLYNARNIAKRWYGEVYVENKEIEGENYLCFRLEV